MSSKNKDKEISFLESILDKLSAMHEVVVEEKADGVVELQKDGVAFGELHNDSLRLLNKNGNYMSVDNSTISNRDQLLREATAAYWIATGQK